MRFADQTLPSCQGLCDADPACLGVFYSSAVSGSAAFVCYTLRALVECGTTLEGDSYTRNRTAPHGDTLPPAAAVAVPDVRAKARVAPNRSAAAVHVVDWRHATPEVWSSGVLPATVFPPLALNISNGILLGSSAGVGARGCGRLLFMLHELGGAPPVVLEGVCAGNVTMLTIPSPVPWSLVEVRPAA